ncbi:MAG: transcription antitermination factor NusB [Lachnospiraceae bacterium]|nr:transcription antitermination factor NusB [Lachnospiraceae bacterium]MBQ8261371.1 transcription antitermination factor NusB [Lachnospiraceae bacterium]
MSRRDIREQVFKLLFRVEFNEIEEMESQTDFFYGEEENATGDEQREEVTAKLNKILDCLEELDSCITENITGWTIERIGKVELTILRLAVFEIKYDDEVPVSVAINEAVELAKKYGQNDSSSFVNGVLAKLAKA